MSTTLTAAEARVVFPDDMTLFDARARYFERSGFDDATYTDRWVKLPVGPLTVALPNLAPRKAAVRIHDLHHVVMGFGSDWAGETEISAFELGAGMGRYGFGWFINTGALVLGLLRAPRRTLRQHARGRRARHSLYTLVPHWDEAILTRTVGAIRSELAVPDEAEADASDVVSALAQGAAGVVLHVGPVVAVLAALVAGVVMATSS